MLPWGEPTGYLRKVVLPTLARQFKFDLNTPWGELAQSVRDCLSARRRWTGKKKKGDTHLGRHPRQRRAALRGERLRHGAHGARGVHARGAVLGVQRPSAQARIARRHDRRQEHRRAHRLLDRPVTLLLRERSGEGREPRHRASIRRSPARSSRKCASGFAFSSTSASTTSRSAAPPSRSRAARRSASVSRRRSARASSACCTSSTSRPSACISATTRGCSPRSSSCAISATRSSSSSTTRRRCAPPTTSSTWGRARASTAAR